MHDEINPWIGIPIAIILWAAVAWPYAKRRYLNNRKASK